MEKPFYFASLVILLLLMAISCLLVLLNWFFTKDLSGTSHVMHDLFANENQSFAEFYLIPLLKESYATFVILIKPIFVLMALCYYSPYMSGLYIYCSIIN